MDGGWLVVRLAGEIDMANAPVIGEIVREAQTTARRDLRLDLTRVEFIDSQGLNVVARAQRRASELGQRIEITGASTSVAKTFEICGMGELLVGNGAVNRDVQAATGS